MADLPEVVKNLIRILSLEQLRHIRILQGAGPGDGGHPARSPFRGNCARAVAVPKSASGNSAIAARVSSRLAECVSCWRPLRCYILASEGKGDCYIIASASGGVVTSESGKLGGFSEII
jgi:hypothetical protein